SVAYWTPTGFGSKFAGSGSVGLIIRKAGAPFVGGITGTSCTLPSAGTSTFVWQRAATGTGTVSETGCFSPSALTSSLTTIWNCSATCDSSRVSGEEADQRAAIRPSRADSLDT